MNLFTAGALGFSDPYCVLLFGKQKQQTRHIRKTLNPAWGEPFQFATTADPGHLQVVVWDKDRLWRDVWPLPTAILDFLGTVTISPESLKGKPKLDQWYQLGPRPGRPKEVVSGDIRLILTLRLPGDESGPASEAGSDSEDERSVKSDSKPSPTSRSSDKGDDKKKERPKSERDDKKKESEGEGESDEMALVNSYLHASQNMKETKKQPKKTVEIKEEPKPKKALKRSELATEAVVKELQSLYQDNPDSCVKSTPPLSTTSAPSHLIRGCVVVVYIAEIKWDRSNKTVSVQLSNAEHGTVNLSIYLADDTNPVTMLESVSGHVDENKVELAPKGTEAAPDAHTEKVDTKGKGKVDDGGLRKSKLGLSQALGKAWRTASATVPTDDEDEDEDYYDDSDCGSDDEYDWDMPAEETVLEKHVKQLQVVFGSECASVWRDLGVVRLFVDAHFFEENAAEAMGVDREQPITVIISFGEGYLENDTVPKVEVKQLKNPRFALEFQLTQIAQKFMKESWPKRKMGVSLPSTTEKKEVAKMKLRTNDVGNLVKQGFDQLAAANALEITDNDFAKAIKLLNSQGGHVDIAELSSSEEAKHNFLGWVMTYMLGRMRNCTSYCLICDVKLEGTTFSLSLSDDASPGIWSDARACPSPPGR
ncbi:C2 domain containing protein [Acanthamoeba castellanii str. Neff]|uniref:C2 domain containing protein n=1 Tax=Acanthamoeba castellanii (strain ATCC 30010 / Neff) TaxID=1257118 RepID=L8HBL2_ACACF|nr:C2 domain containing protein [Acanthamoeba castellanii str. Neff]ELR22617.1 C2 domain containing protein [Acanthamoeba castellanii str. Neff]